MEKENVLKQKKNSKNSSWNFPPELSLVGWSLWSVPFGLAPKHSRRSVKNVYEFKLRLLALLHLTPCSSSNLHSLFSGLASLHLTHITQTVCARVWTVLTFHSPHRHYTSCSSHLHLLQLLKPLPLHNSSDVLEDFPWVCLMSFTYL